jgi:hypothetical protein
MQIKVRTAILALIAILLLAGAPTGFYSLNNRHGNGEKDVADHQLLCLAKGKRAVVYG